MKENNKLKLLKRWLYYYDVEEQPNAPTLVSISATKVQTEYYVNDEFNTDDITVTCTWSDATTTTVTSGFTCTIPDMTTAGTKTATVTYQGKTATINIVVSVRQTYPESMYSHFVIVRRRENWDGAYILLTSVNPVTGYRKSSANMYYASFTSGSYKIYVSTDDRQTWTQTKTGTASTVQFNDTNTHNHSIPYADGIQEIERDYEPVLALMMSYDNEEEESDEDVT